MLPSNMACNCGREQTLKIVLGVSIALLVCSAVLLVMFPTIYETQMRKEISLGEGSMLSSIWEDIPLPIYEKLYFFNVTNGDQFTKGKEPLNVVQVGPYVYKARWVKQHPKWNSNKTVSYRETRTYDFVPELTRGSPDDKIYTLNAPLIIGTDLLKDKPFWLRLAASIFFGVEGETVVIKKSIRELAYDGYDDPILKFAPILKPDIPFKDGKFKWLYDKNATNDGLFTVFTGENDTSKTNLINRWNGEDRLSFWKNKSCNMLKGTSIETGPPLQPGQETYTFFQTIFCRALTFNYSDSVELYGVKGKRFVSTYDLFANSSENPDNACFEVGEQKPSGVLNVSPCQFNAPVFLSFPHFHFGDPAYRNLTTGLEPNGSLHGSHVDVHSETGLSIDISVKFQINLDIKRVAYFLQLGDIKEGIYPVLWADINFRLDEHMANFLKSKLYTPKIIAYSLLGALCLLSAIAVVVCAVLLYRLGGDGEHVRLIENEDVAVVEKEISEEENKIRQKQSGHSQYNSINSSDADRTRE